MNNDKKTTIVKANGFQDKYRGRLSNKNNSRITIKKNLEKENPKKIPTVMEINPKYHCF